MLGLNMLDKYKEQNHFCPYCGKKAGFHEEYVESHYSISDRQQVMIQYFHRKCYLENVRKEKEKWAKLLDLK